MPFLVGLDGGGVKWFIKNNAVSPISCGYNFAFLVSWCLESEQVLSVKGNGRGS